MKMIISNNITMNNGNKFFIAKLFFHISELNADGIIYQLRIYTNYAQ